MREEDRHIQPEGEVDPRIRHIRNFHNLARVILAEEDAFKKDKKGYKAFAFIPFAEITQDGTTISAFEVTAKGLTAQDKANLLIPEEIPIRVGFEGGECLVLDQNSAKIENEKGQVLRDADNLDLSFYGKIAITGGVRDPNLVNYHFVEPEVPGGY